MERVDILLATYNGTSYINDFFASLSAQTYTNWRLIVRDDCSRDDTLSKVIAFEENNRGKVLVLDSEHNIGVKRNFSELMSRSSAKYIFFADQDDVWRSDKIKLTLDFAKRIDDVDDIPLLVHTDLTVVDEELRVISSSFWRYQGLHPERGRNLKDIMVQNVVTGCTMMINRKLIEIAGPVPSSARMHDWWLAILACAAGNVYYINKQTVLYRQHGNNDIGAKRYSFKSALYALKYPSTHRDSLILTQDQANAFIAIYHQIISEHDTTILSKFANMKHQGFIGKRITAARLRLRKNGILRTIGFYALM